MKKRFAVAAMIAAGALLAGSTGQAQDVVKRNFIMGESGVKLQHVFAGIPARDPHVGMLVEFGGVQLGWRPGQNWLTFTRPRERTMSSEKQTDFIPPADRPQKVAPNPATKSDQKRTDERRVPPRGKTTFPEYADRENK